jgi:hypothetical protein
MGKFNRNVNKHNVDNLNGTGYKLLIFIALNMLATAVLLLITR